MAARFCPQCGNEVSSAAKFCPNCAQPLTLPAAVLPPRDPAHKPRALLLPAALVTVVVLAAALAVLAAKSRTSPSLLVSPPPSAASAPAVTNAPPPVPTSAPPLTNAPTQKPFTGPAVTNAPDKPASALPPDAAAYLFFLQGIEQKRIALNNDVAGANAMLGIAQGMQTAGATPDTETDGSGGEGNGGQDAAKQNTQKLSQGYSEYAAKWQGLIREFRATPAPPSCTILATRYQTFLGDYTTIISKMQVALLNHDSSGLPDLSAVTQVQAQVNTDSAQADGALTDLCARYGVSKPFTIAPEGASPSLLGH